MGSRCPQHVDGRLNSQISSNSSSYASYTQLLLPNTDAPYWDHYNDISNYNVHLNFLERLWAAWYAYIGNDVLATGIMSFVLHELVYFGRSIPWMIIASIPYFNRYKIQNVSATFQPADPTQF